MLAALMTDPDAGHRSAAQIHRRLVADGRGFDLASVPTTVDGIDQEPMDGTSFVHTFDEARRRRRRGASHGNQEPTSSVLREAHTRPSRVLKHSLSAKQARQLAVLLVEAADEVDRPQAVASGGVGI